MNPPDTPQLPNSTPPASYFVTSKPPKPHPSPPFDPFHTPSSLRLVPVSLLPAVVPITHRFIFWVRAQAKFSDTNSCQMIAIDFSIRQWQWQWQISTTFVLGVILPCLLWVWAKYFSPSPNRYNKLEEPVKMEMTVPDEAKPHWKGKRLYQPTLKVEDEPLRIQAYCPATGQNLGTYPATSRAEIDAAIGAAKKAQQLWKHLLFTTRRRLLKTLSRFVVTHQTEIARVACRDLGKTKLDALMGEIMVTLEKLNWIVAHGERALRPSQRPGPANWLIGMMKLAEVRYEPLGVVAAMVLWNYPFHNLMGPVIAGLFSGNAVVVKCSEQVVWLLRWFVALVRTALRAMDLDENLVQLVYCFPDDADYFTAHPGLNHITFIGLAPVARHVVATAAKLLTPCVVELGGKDACLVLDLVANLEALALVIMRGTYQSAGQNCIGIERVIACPELFAQLTDIFARRVRELRVGLDIDQLDEIDVGAMVSGHRFDTLEAIIADARDKGAEVVCGGKRYSHPNYPQGHYFEPTLVVGVTPEMRLFLEEVFGPILTLVRADSTEHAVELANATEYGLGALVFGGDFAELNQVANELDAGNVAINDFATFYVAQLPFGGIKQSGYGKFGGEEGLQGLCVAKLVIMDKGFFRMLGVKTAIPPPLDYPIKDDKKAWLFVSSLNIAGYDLRLWQVVKSLRKLAKGGA